MECPNCNTPINEQTIKEEICKSCGTFIELNTYKEQLEDLRLQISLIKEKVKFTEERRENCEFENLKFFMTFIDWKDSYTSNHSERVAELSIKVAKTLGYSVLLQSLVEKAARLHDIGKMWIDKEILRAERPLTAEELTEIHMHPILGANAVGSITSLQCLREPILNHHEHFDGSGYPEGLKGRLEISQIAMILNICDAIDAMRINRPYRKAKTHDEIMAELKNQSGKQFDPELVDLFLDGKVTF